MFIEFSLHEWAVSSTLSSFREHKNAGLLWCLHQRLRIMTNWCLTSTMIPQGTLKLLSLPVSPYTYPGPSLSWSADCSWKTYLGIAAFTAHLGCFFVQLSVDSLLFLQGPDEYCHFSRSPSFLSLLCRNKTKQNSLLLASNFYVTQFVPL